MAPAIELGIFIVKKQVQRIEDKKLIYPLRVKKNLLLIFLQGLRQIQKQYLLVK